MRHIDHLKKLMINTTAPIVYSEYTVNYSDSSSTICNSTTTITIYQGTNGLGFNLNAPIYSDSAGNNFAPAHFYTDGLGYREWDGTAWRGASATNC